MNCTKCGNELSPRATYCPCGWQKARREHHDQQHIQCAHQTCGITAMCKIKTATGWASLCWQHYDDHFRIEALSNLDKWGMARLGDESTPEWVGRMRQFVKSGFKAFGKGAQSSSTTA